ncbi:glycosyltransferase family 4 protein [Paracoccaceae bacterium]|nr:glycosyltransferase family 4 protein [Paracoccaceae bacterium]
MILVVANTIIGKQGNIGYRIAKVFEKEDQSNYIMLARGLEGSFSGYSYGFFGFLSRCLNGVRRYAIPKFNSRKYDIYLFNFVTILHYHFYIKSKYTIKTVYLCETSVFLIHFFRKQGFFIVLDIPIAPNRHVKNILKNYDVPEFYYNTFLDKQEMACLRIADRIITPSDYIKDMIASIYHNADVRKISFGVDYDNSVKDSVYLKKRKYFTFGYLGNVSPRKGCNQLLDAWAIKNEFSDSRLLLQGKLYPGFKDKLINSKVDYRPFGDKKTFFESIDVMVLPSFMEGSAKVIYEALACGKQVYVSEYSGAPYIDNYGIHLLNSLDPVNLSNQLNSIEENYIGPLDKRYVEKFVNYYSWENYARQVRALLV